MGVPAVFAVLQSTEDGRVSVRLGPGRRRARELRAERIEWAMSTAVVVGFLVASVVMLAWTGGGW